MMIVEEAYNRLATITGFPLYVNDTDTPETVRFLLENLSEALRSLISKLYIANNVLERTDTIKTKVGEEKYAVSGIIKKVQLILPNGSVRDIPYNNVFDKNTILDKSKAENNGAPLSYVIEKGYLRLLPIPNGIYTLKVTQSTTDLVWKNNDISSTVIDNIRDTIMADQRFCNLVILNAAALIFARCRNENAQIYANLFRESLDRYIEEDYGSMQAIRGFGGGRAGHYDSEGGLLG